MTSTAHIAETAVARLTEARRADSHAKAAAVHAALDAAVTAGGALTVAAVARQAGVSRRFYDHPELRAAIELAATEAVTRFSGRLAITAQVSAASLRADLANTRSENRRLRQQVRVLAERLSHVLGQEVAAELAARDVITTNPMPHEQITSLQARNGELEGELRRRDDELEGARQANRDLMAELNRRRPQP
jgi:chromosome segregation ATPase